MAVVLAFSLVAAACGDSPNAGPTAADSSTTTDTLSPPPVTVPNSFEPTANLTRSLPAPDTPVADVVAGFNEAGFDLLRTQAVEDNVVLSPASVGHALLMARAAADQATGTAIDAALQLPDGISAHQAWNAIDQAINSAAAAE